MGFGDFLKVAANPTAALGTALAGGYASYRGSKDIAKAYGQSSEYQAAAAERALAFQKQQYEDIRPYLMGSLEGYQNLLQDQEAFKQTPGYLFRLQEGLKSIGIPQGSQHLSGAQLKAAIRYGQDYASNEYSNALRRYAGMGELAQGVGGVGSNYATSMGNILQQQAGYRAQGTLGAAQARASGYLGMANSLGYGMGMMQQGFNPLGGGGGGQTLGPGSFV